MAKFRKKSSHIAQQEAIAADREVLIYETLETNSEPLAFATWARVVSDGVFSIVGEPGTGYEFPSRDINPNFVVICFGYWFELPGGTDNDEWGNEDNCGFIRLLKLPNGKTQVTVSAYETDWPKLRPVWNWLKSQLHFPAGQGAGQQLPTEPTPPASSPPGRPAPPDKEAPIDSHFDWYHQCKNAGYRVTLNDVAKNTGLAPKTVNNYHGDYKAEKFG